MARLPAQVIHVELSDESAFLTERYTGYDLSCDVSFCTAHANVIHNGVKLCRSHYGDPEWEA